MLWSQGLLLPSTLACLVSFHWLLVWASGDMDVQPQTTREVCPQLSH